MSYLRMRGGFGGGVSHVSSDNWLLALSGLLSSWTHTHKSNKIVGHDICEKWKIRETLLFFLPVIFRCWKATTIIPTFS